MKVAINNYIKINETRLFNNYILWKSMKKKVWFSHSLSIGGLKVNYLKKRKQPKEIFLKKTKIDIIKNYTN